MDTQITGENIYVNYSYVVGYFDCFYVLASVLMTDD